MTNRNRRDRNARKEANSEANITIQAASLDELRNMRAELNREIGMRAKAINNLRKRSDCIAAEMEKRRCSTTEGIYISDHAVLRYLERVKKIDILAMREEITQIAKRAEETGIRNETKSTILDEETNLTFGINDKEKTITTIYNKKDLIVLHTPTVSG